MLGPGSIAVIGVVALIVFGPKKLPELGKATGKALREFKNATNGIIDDEDEKEKKDKQDTQE